MSDFKEIDFKELKFSPYETIAKNWLALTAGNKEKYNSMTVSWGQVGALWNGESGAIPVVTVYVRPSRFTNHLMEKNQFFTVSSFGDKRRLELAFLGRRTGKDFENKILESGLTPMFVDDAVAIEEAELIFVCKKIYEGEILKENILDDKILDKNYSNDNFHKVYVGEIVKVLKKE